MMQFNVYHHYTVDEHTIQCISTLAQIERGELVEELPVAIRHPERGREPPGALCRAAAARHRQGPARGSFDPRRPDRAQGGAAARASSAEECETVEWLVRYHLLMSDMAQKRDLGDPRTVRDFAKAVKTRKSGSTC